MWHDFAPRNVIIDFNKKVIGFVDFERGLTMAGSKWDKVEYYYYLSNIVAEEWGAFLTIDEFNYLLPNFWNSVKEVDDKPCSLVSKRKSAIFKVLYPEHVVTIKKVVSISKAMQEVAQAKKIGKGINFPLIAIEKMTRKLGPNYYAQIVWQHLQGR